MTKNDIYNYLCYYDERSPYYEMLLLDEEKKKPKNCSCDNCFYGRTKLAEFIIENIYHE